MSEIAIISANKPLLKQMAKLGNKGANDVLKLLGDTGKFLSTVQVGITLVGILAGVYSGATIAKHFAVYLNQVSFIYPLGDAISISLVVALITYLSVVIGEIIPKKIALSNPEKLSILVVKPMLAVSFVFSPFVKIFDLSTKVIMTMFGLSQDQEKITEDEVRAVINEGAESGAIEKSEQEMLQRVIRLDDRDVKSIMTHVSEITFIKIDDSTEDVKSKIKSAKHARYPVIDVNGKIIGVVQAKELLNGVLSSSKINIAEHIRTANFVSENTSCLRIIEMFKSSAIHLAVVIDEYGATEGIVTDSDIFEAIVGSLPSNYDENDFAMIRMREDGSWLVDGMTALEEINITIGIEEIDANESFDTIAGFIIDSIKKSVTEGDKFTKYGYEFEVIDMDGLRIDKILISKK
jgi:putative hemolysin